MFGSEFDVSNVNRNDVGDVGRRHITKQYRITKQTWLHVSKPVVSSTMSSSSSDEVSSDGDTGFLLFPFPLLFFPFFSSGSTNSTSPSSVPPVDLETSTAAARMLRRPSS